MNELNRFIIDNMVWSFSRLNSYDTGCKYEWYRRYIECEEPQSNFFAEVGSFCHKILEMYAKGELTIWELPQYYEDHFSEEVVEPAPFHKNADIGESTYNKCYDYFCNIDLDFSDYIVEGVEKKIEFELEGYKFVGFIDLLLRDKKDGKLILVDHKSSTISKLKSGKIAKKDKGHFEEFQKQQFLYSCAVLQEYESDSIKELKWNMFKDRDWLSVPWDQKKYEDTLRWAVDTIHRIENEEEWGYKSDWYFCANLCSYRNNCSEKKIF